MSNMELDQIVAAVEGHGSISAAARALGRSRETVRDAYHRAVRLNLTGDFKGPRMPAGYHLGKVTSLVGPDGTVQMEWQHRLPLARSPEDIAKAIADGLAQVPPAFPQPAFTGSSAQNLLTLYPIADLHLMMLAWGRETGDDYDLSVAQQDYMATYRGLMDASPPSDTAVLLNLGDYFHADNNNAQTEKSKNHLDVDSRMQKALMVGAELQAWTIDLLLSKHRTVIVRNQRGNHDPNIHLALNVGMRMRYLKEPRVQVDLRPQEYWFYQWGTTMLAAHHGDLAKGEDMPGIMAAFEPQMWGHTNFRYAFLGHIHRSKKAPPSDEKNGATWEYLPSLAGKDAWNKSMGHASKRSASAITFNRICGEESRVTRNIKGA